MPKTKASTKAKASTKTAAASTRTTVTQTTAKRNYTAAITRRLRKDLTIGALFAELVGTFGLVTVLLNTNANAIIAGVAVLVFVMVFGKISGAHINPAVTVAMLATRQISAVRAGGYVIAQLLGAMLALVVISQFVHAAPGVPNPYTGETAPAQVFALSPLSGDWRPFFAEMLGAFIFGLGVAAATFTKREGLEAGYMIGGALIIGLLIATQGAGAVLNPAAALGLDGYRLDNQWTVAVYAIAPLIGASAGAWLFKLVQRDAAAAG